jgi:ABC-type Fe3+/spermidine/putrescine transport system ATPase subunit
MVFQDFALFPHLNVEANIAFGLKKKDKDKVFEMLKKVKLEGLERRYPHELSGGQQQRVALARSLAVEPKVLLLDEPFSNLDPSLKQDMTWELKEWLKSLTVLMVTHDAKDALAVADKLVLMRKGSVVQYGRPYDLYRNPVNLYCASYFGTINVFDAQQLFDFFRLEFQQGLYMVRAEDFHAELVESGCLLLSQIYQGGKWLACMDLEGKKIFSYLPKEYEVNRSFFRLIPKNITALKP